MIDRAVHVIDRDLGKKEKNIFKKYSPTLSNPLMLHGYPQRYYGFNCYHRGSCGVWLKFL